MPFIPAAILPALIGGGIAAGGSVASSLIGRSSNNTMIKAQQGIANEQAARDREVFNRSTPAFNQAMQYYSGVTQGGPQLQQMVGPAASKINSQWDSAYKNILGNAYTRGGALDKGLRQTQSGRAMALSDLYGQAHASGPAGLLQLSGMGGNGAGLAASANTLANAQQAKMMEQQQRAQALSGVGGFLTRLLSTPGLFTGHQDSFSNSGFGGPGTASLIGQTSGLPPAVMGDGI